MVGYILWSDTFCGRIPFEVDKFCGRIHFFPDMFSGDSFCTNTFCGGYIVLGHVL